MMTSAAAPLDAEKRAPARMRLDPAQRAPHPPRCRDGGTPARRSRASTRPRDCPDMCWATQPPQRPKWRQMGAARSGLSVSRIASAPSTRQRSPGSANGTNRRLRPRLGNAVALGAEAHDLDLGRLSHRSTPPEETPGCPSRLRSGTPRRPATRHPGCAPIQLRNSGGGRPRARSPRARSRPCRWPRVRPRTAALTSATSQAPGAASASGAGSAFASEMKLTSATMACIGLAELLSRERLRASHRSSDTTRGSPLIVSCSCPCPTSTA